MGPYSWGFVHGALFISLMSLHFISLSFILPSFEYFTPIFKFPFLLFMWIFILIHLRNFCVICVLTVYLVNDSDNSVPLYTLLVICLLNDHQFFIRHYLTTRLNFDSDCQMIHIRANLLFSSIISAISHSDLLSSNLIDFASSFSFILACIAAISIASARRSLFLLVHSLISLMLVEFSLS